MRNETGKADAPTDGEEKMADSLLAAPALEVKHRSGLAEPGVGELGFWFVLVNTRCSLPETTGGLHAGCADNVRDENHHR